MSTHNINKLARPLTALMLATAVAITSGLLSSSHRVYADPSGSPSGFDPTAGSSGLGGGGGLCGVSIDDPRWTPDACIVGTADMPDPNNIPSVSMPCNPQLPNDALDGPSGDVGALFTCSQKCFAPPYSLADPARMNNCLQVCYGTPTSASGAGNGLTQYRSDIPCKFTLGQPYAEWVLDVTSSVVQLVYADLARGYQKQAVDWWLQTTRQMNGAVCLLPIGEGVPVVNGTSKNYASPDTPNPTTPVGKPSFPPDVVATKGDGERHSDDWTDDGHRGQKDCYSLFDGRDNCDHGCQSSPDMGPSTGMPKGIMWNYKTDFCGKFCAFTTDQKADSGDFRGHITLSSGGGGTSSNGSSSTSGGTNSTCSLESSWLRGEYYYAKFFYLHRVLGHLLSGGQYGLDPTTLVPSIPPAEIGAADGKSTADAQIAVPVTALQGINPCGYNAADVIKITKEIQDSVFILRASMPPTAGASGASGAQSYSDVMDACRYIWQCLNIDKTGKLLGGSNPVNSWKSLCKNNGPGSKVYLNAVGDPANGIGPNIQAAGTCGLGQAQNLLKALWVSFLSCEVSVSAQVDFVLNSLADDMSNNYQPFVDAVGENFEACDDESSDCATGAINKAYRTWIYDAMMNEYGKYLDPGQIGKPVTYKVRTGGGRGKPVTYKNETKTVGAPKYFPAGYGLNMAVDKDGNPSTNSDRMLASHFNPTQALFDISSTGGAELLNNGPGPMVTGPSGQ